MFYLRYFTPLMRKQGVRKQFVMRFITSFFAYFLFCLPSVEARIRFSGGDREFFGIEMFSSSIFIVLLFRVRVFFSFQVFPFIYIIPRPWIAAIWLVVKNNNRWQYGKVDKERFLCQLYILNKPHQPINHNNKPVRKK
jgi:hypothetical protein